MYVYYVFISRCNIIKLDRLSRLSLGNPSLNPLSLGIVPKDRGTGSGRSSTIFGLKKNPGDFSSVDGSRHFSELRFLHVFLGGRSESAGSLIRRER